MNLDFERVVRNVHDHLYANANIRTPEDLQAEVAKVIRTLIYLRRRPEPAAQTKRRLNTDQLALWNHDLTAPALRKSYLSMDGQHARKASIRIDDSSLEYAATQLAQVDYGDTSRDYLGDALEVFRSISAKRLGGQFFTNPRVTHLAVALLEYDPSADDFVDICAGTGGFLIAAAHAARPRRGDCLPILGVEVDSKLAALANRTLSELQLPAGSSVHVSDSLKNPALWPAAVRRSVGFGMHRCLASNPPFGTKVTIKDPAILERLALGHHWDKRQGQWSMNTSSVTARPPDVLFLERNFELAQPGSGRVAIVLPYQVLSGPRLGFVREWLLRNSRIIAVVDLPDDTFQPWTGTKTALLVYERRTKPLSKWVPEDYPIFMAVAHSIGHDRRGNPVLDSNGSVLTDLPSVAEAFRAARHQREPSSLHRDAFLVSASAVTPESDLRLNARYHRPSAAELRTTLTNGHGTSALRTVRLGDVVQRVFCPGRFRRTYVDDARDGVLFLGGTNVTQFQVTNRKYLSRADPHLDDMLVKEGWILVTRSGSTGIVSSVPFIWDGLAISEHVIRIVPDGSKLSPGYLEMILRSSWGQRLLSAGVFGSVIDEITPEFVADLMIPVPASGKLTERVAGLQDDANRSRGAGMSAIERGLALLDESLGRWLR